jgi:DNA-directed RNA polymerase subunit RPC12/RpoP
MSWSCPRCHTFNDEDKYHCSKCSYRNPEQNEAHYRWNDWKCPRCGAENGGAFQRCGRCDERNPN